MIEITSRLPAGYQEVEYIQSSGTQYVDSDYIPNQNTRIVAEMEYVSHTNQTCGLFGVGMTSTKVFEVYHYNGKYYFAYGASQNTVTTTVVTGEKMLIDVSSGLATISISGTVVDLTPSIATTFTSDGTMYIHALHRSNGAGYLSKTKTYSFKIYDNSILVRDFVPCYRKADSVAGLYDLVNGAFYGNAGSGVFTKGADVNTQIVVTQGGVIPKKWALRRKILATGINQAQKNNTIQLTGTFYYEPGAYSSVVVNGSTYNSAQTIEIPAGTEITLSVFTGGIYEPLPSTIIVDGVIVAKQTNAGQTIIYKHTVNADCIIESYVIYDGNVLVGTVLGLKLTSS